MKLEQIQINKVTSAELDTEYNKELDSLIDSVKEINEIHSEMSVLISSQNEKIELIDKDIDKTAGLVDSSNGQLVVASEYQQSIFWKKSFLLTLCTAVVTAPVSVFIGAKAAIIAGVGTVVYGAINFFG
jgi:t-SNARE complex subunit (syntaxin)